jgi:hypothetical protein
MAEILFDMLKADFDTEIYGIHGFHEYEYEYRIFFIG